MHPAGRCVMADCSGPRKQSESGMKMRTIITPRTIKHLGLWLLLLAIDFTAFAQGTAFTYQGRLADGGVPGNGVYDIRAGLLATNSGGTAVAGPITNSSVTVS